MDKSAPLVERMLHAFGTRTLDINIQTMLNAPNRDILDCLTDEARAELLRRCIRTHKLSRKYAAESRKHYQAKMLGGM